MKYKNYKSAIHNFGHSFQSIDYSKSGKLVFNTLVQLNNKGLEPNVTFDFIRKQIIPIQAENESSKKLMNDYLSWLPEHFMRHNCDISKLEKLEINVKSNFIDLTSPNRMDYCKQVEIETNIKWQASGKEIETIQLKEIELVKTEFFKIGVPEFQ
jgi:hypothetical protein